MEKEYQIILENAKIWDIIKYKNNAECIVGTDKQWLKILIKNKARIIY